ncbi:MAG: cystathionine gamma-synthase family protein [Gemmatimonadetes bacterium]|nr:cystathionine gamma-synthase family protein [Gemmatimonadota bacterium]
MRPAQSPNPVRGGPAVTRRKSHPRYKERRIGQHVLKPESQMMGYGYDPMLSEGAVKCPIFQTSTFVFESAEAGKKFFELAYGLREPGPGETPGLIYSRLNNPDTEILEDRLTLWDEAEAAAGFDSGMAAIATSLFTFVRPGDVLVHSDPLYGGTEFFLDHVLSDFGVTPIRFPAGVPLAGIDPELRTRIGGRRVGAVFIETPANPTNALVDIADVARFARSQASGDHRPVVMVDNTFLGPLWQHPLKHGADLVLYSATKFIGGHSDVIAGAALGRHDVVERVRRLRGFLGTLASPWTGWLLLRSLETLKMRMTAQMKNARYVADFLADHPKVAAMHYLGHIEKDHPMYATYRRQCLGAGSLVSFEIQGGEPAAFQFLNSLKLIHLAVSLGGTESLAEHPATMTHADLPADERERMGITPGMVRLSVGVEHYQDIIADLEQALEAVDSAGTQEKAARRRAAPPETTPARAV